MIEKALTMTTTAIDPAQVSDFLRGQPALAEQVVAEYLMQHQEMLARIQLPSGHTGRAISLHERQLEVLREKNKGLEQRLVDLMRLGQENDAINDKLQQWTRQLLLTDDSQAAPGIVLGAMERIFSVPQMALRLWSGSSASASYVVEPNESARAWVDGLNLPFCGSVAQVPKEHWARLGPWLTTPGVETRSVAILALRKGIQPTSFGVLMLGSADLARFAPAMGTLFLERIAETASAALARLAA
jgi:uncharacterized protein